MGNDYHEEMLRRAEETNRSYRRLEEERRRERERLEASQKIYFEGVAQQERNRRNAEAERGWPSLLQRTHSNSKVAGQPSVVPRRKRRRLLLCLLIGGFVYWAWGKF